MNLVGGGSAQPSSTDFLQYRAIRIAIMPSSLSNCADLITGMDLLSELANIDFRRIMTSFETVRSCDNEAFCNSFTGDPRSVGGVSSPFVTEQRSKFIRLLLVSEYLERD